MTGPFFQRKTTVNTSQIFGSNYHGVIDFFFIKSNLSFFWLVLVIAC